MNRNQNGFSVIEILMIVVIVTLLGTTGYLVYKSHHQPTKVVATKTVTAQAKSTPTKTSPATTTNTSVIQIPELGIEITVPYSLADLTYATGPENSFGSGTTGTSAWLSTKSLGVADINCAANTGLNADGSAYSGDPLGRIGKINGMYPGTTTESSGSLVLQETGYYIAFQPSQSTCSVKQNVQTMQANDKLALKVDNTTVKLIQ